ncbi:PAS domain-containing sensor histidine kinase [Sporocytophaga myxococcoides]|uniref:PAS domain-containing sensor histidine kinase n=1 Tax=Sporocytophaga myxococcoides TaxID=153721 RepID=UPI00042A19EB|nr:PAS domain-containing sensor histidine kinase [Sporocytophaga myxococcoides]
MTIFQGDINRNTVILRLFLLTGISLAFAFFIFTNTYEDSLYSYLVFTTLIVALVVINLLSLRVFTQSRKDVINKVNADNMVTLLDNISDICCICDKDFRFIYWNKAAQEISGYAFEEIAGKRFDDLFKSASTPERDKLIGQMMMEKRKSLTFSYEAFMKGVLNQFEITVFPSGENYIYLVRNITDKLLIEQQNNRTNKILEATSDLVAMVNVQGQNVYMNYAGVKLLDEKNNAGNIRRSLMEMHPPDVYKYLITEAIPYALKHGTWQGESRFITSEGKTIPVSQVIIAHLDSQGHLEYISTIARDISKEKQAEEELKKINFELDHFVYRASHDLRAPLTSIRGLVEISLEEKDTQKLKQYMSFVGESAKKLDNYIINLLSISRNDRLEMEQRPIDFSILIQEAIDELRFLKNADRINITWDISCDGQFCSDLIRLKIIFKNIISNAIKYQRINIANSFLSINISGSPQLIRAVFTDNGIGIHEDSKERIFDMFYRGTELSDGSGLGLYIVKSVIEKLKGRIQLHSKISEGTTTIIEIPGYSMKKEADQEL